MHSGPSDASLANDLDRASDPQTHHEPHEPREHTFVTEQQADWPRFDPNRDSEPTFSRQARDWCYLSPQNNQAAEVTLHEQNIRAEPSTIADGIWQAFKHDENEELAHLNALTAVAARRSSKMDFLYRLVDSRGQEAKKREQEQE